VSGFTNERMWAITGDFLGERHLYVGTWLLRSDAIREHSAEVFKTWRECRKEGDRCEKVTVVHGWLA